MPEANYENPLQKIKNKKEESVEKDKNKDKEKINNNTNNSINCKGNTFPNNCLPDINLKIKKKKLNEDNNKTLVNEEEKAHRETDINNNIAIIKKKSNNIRINKNNTYDKLIKEKKMDSMGLLKKAKLMKINDFDNKNSSKIETEINKFK